MHGASVRHSETCLIGWFQQRTLPGKSLAPPLSNNRNIFAISQLANQSTLYSKNKLKNLSVFIEWELEDFGKNNLQY